MNTSRIVAAFLTGAALLVSLSAPAGERRALLIGIDKYASSDIPTLGGAVNDVEMMERVLSTRFGFSEQRIVKLTNEKATRRNILKQLEKLVADAKSDDIVYIHFSGHGSQVQDINGDEVGDGKDETLVPHDARQPGVADITDDELASIVDGFKTKEVVLVLDSCHSGTGLRGFIRPRFAQEDTRVDLYKRNRINTEPPRGGVQTRAITMLRDQDIILLTGAADKQSALDGPVDSGAVHGFFSFALARALDAQGPAATPRSLHDKIKVEFQRMQEGFGGMAFPEPQLEGQESKLLSAIFPSLLQNLTQADSGETQTQRPDRTPKFTEVAGTADRVYVPARVAGGGQVRLLGGVYVNAGAGSMWAIYPSRDLRFDRARAIATARVVETVGYDSIALIDPPTAQIGDQAVATSIVPAPPGQVVKVELHGPSSEREALRAEFAALGDVEVVPAGQFARYVIDVGPTVIVHGAAGLKEQLRFGWNGAADAVGRITPLITRAANASQIKSLVNDASRMYLDATLIGQTEVRSEPTRGIKVTAAETGVCRFRRSGQPRSHSNSLMLEIETDTPAYVTVVNVDGSSGITTLFPNSAQGSGFYPQGLIPAFETVRIPDSFEGGNLARFHWDCAEPAGVDTLTVFAATDLETAQRLRTYIDELKRAATATRTRSADRSSNEDLANLRAAVARRGVAVVPDEVPAGADGEDVIVPAASAGNTDWASVSISVQVAP